jgi:hypothetical protein
MCKVMQVSVSGYYYWLKHPVGSRTVKEQQVLIDIARIYEDSKKRGPQSGLGLQVHGSLRITSELREQGISVSRP